MERLFNANSHICMSMIAVVPGKDYEIGKLYPKEVPVPVGSFFVPAITCNDFVFVAGQMASDENALDPSVKLPKEVRNWGGPNAVRRQTEFVIRKRLEPALKAGGSSWNNILKAQIYVPSAADIPDALDVWQQHVKAPCALTAVPTKGFGFIDGVVEINLLALRDGAKRRKEVLEPDLPALSSYGAHVRAGELVFCSGLMPLGADGRVPGLSSFDALGHPAQAQAAAVLSHAERLCKEGGSIVRAQWFMADVQAFAAVQLAWSRRQGDAPHPFACVQVPGELGAPGALLTADFWIYSP
jgi:enamine deaminase RidA (YjgF/YER057c/UK114 family)